MCVCMYKKDIEVVKVKEKRHSIFTVRPLSLPCPFLDILANKRLETGVEGLD